MPSLRFNTTGLAAGAVVQNLLTGSKFEYMPAPAAIIVYAVSDIAGVNLELAMGNVIEADQLEIPIFPAASGGPNVQDHRLAAGTAAAGDRLQVRLQNGGAGAAAVRTLVEIRPL